MVSFELRRRNSSILTAYTGQVQTRFDSLMKIYRQDDLLDMIASCLAQRKRIGYLQIACWVPPPLTVLRICPQADLWTSRDVFETKVRY